MTQTTIDFDPAVSQDWPTLRQFVGHLAEIHSKALKVQAADMDLAPSTLSRKLNPRKTDTQRLNLDDLEAWLASTGEAARVVGYLAAKYLDSDECRRARVFTRAQALMAELARVLPALKEAAV